MKTIFNTACLATGLLFFIGSAPAYSAETPGAVQKHMEQSVNKASHAGQETESWLRERQQLVEELQNLELQDTWLDFQIEKSKRWLTGEQKNIAILEGNLAQAERTKANLAPFLEVLYADLEAHVEKDLPFAEEERARRLAFIRASLDDPQAQLSDKFGRILEALQVESDYGYSIDVAEKVVENPDGTASQVHEFRLGRLGIFRLDHQATTLQRYVAGEDRWENVDSAAIADVQKAMEIARKKRVTQVVKVPVGKLQVEVMP